MLCIMNAAHTKLTKWALQKVHIKTEAVILDIGCGGGKTIHTLSKELHLGKYTGLITPIKLLKTQKSKYERCKNRESNHSSS